MPLRCVAFFVTAIMVMFPGIACDREMKPESSRATGVDPDTSAAESLLALPDLYCAAQPNGCGPSGLLGDLIPNCPINLVCFTQACNEHDVCYTTCGQPKPGCDNQFFRSMVLICGENFDPGDERHERCLDVAYIYWQVVARYGLGAFDDMQTWACVCGEIEYVYAEDTAPKAVNLAVSAPFIDADDDLMPDDWEASFGLNPDDPTDAALDYDADGLINLYEYIHGTDPRDADTDGDGVDDGVHAELAQQRQTGRPDAR